MLEIRNILAPVDFSERSASALEHAGELARHFGAGLLCVHIIAPTLHEYQMMGLGLAPDVAPADMDRIHERIRTLASAAAPGLAVETLVLTGDPAREIEGLVAARGIDLIVMATRGYGRFRRLLVGSVVSKVLHDTSCPVLTGVHLEDHAHFHSAPNHTAPYRTVACALALRDRADSERILRWSAALARSSSASLHVIHVPPFIDWSPGEWFPDETQQLVREAAREKLQALLSTVGCEADLHVEGAQAVPYVCQVVRDIDADVLVVGRSSEHALLRGGDAFALIRESPCPVISV